MTIEVNGVEFMFSYNTHKHNYKWNSFSSKVATIRNYTYDDSVDYSISEINKLRKFIEIANDMISDIKNTIDESQKTIIGIEGYSYSKDPGPIIDLVGIGSIIRCKLIELIPNIESINIISPKTVKCKTAELVYGSKIVINGKVKLKEMKVVNPNHIGIIGNNFSKTDMLQCVVDYDGNSKYVSYVKDNSIELLTNKNVPKPIEDINDSFFIKEIIKIK